jgi:DNA-binding NarL/FixJ family response regulator
MLADDHPLVPHAVRGVLEGSEFELAATAQSGEDVLQLIDQIGPDLLILDLWLPGISGLRLLEQLAEHRPELPVVVLSGDEDPDDIQLALRLGARAYILKTLAVGDLPAILRQLTAGRVYAAPAARAEPAHECAGGSARLTSKELEILRLVVDGLSNGAIARQLWLSRETIKTHLSNIYRKLGVTSRTQAAKVAHDLRLVERALHVDSVLADRVRQTTVGPRG